MVHHPYENEAAGKWLTDLADRGRSPATLRQHERFLGLLFDYIQAEGDLLPADVDFRRLIPIRSHGALLGHGPVNLLFVEQFLAWACAPVPDRERAAHLRNELLETLHLFFRSLVASERLEKDPTVDVRRAKTQVRVNHRKYLTPVESAALLDAAAKSGVDAPRNFTLVLILLRTGLRPAEACGLCLLDVDLKRGQIKVTGKTGPRAVSLVPAAHEVLDRYLKSPYFRSRRPPEDALFPADDGQAAIDSAGLRKLVKELCQAAGIERGVTTYWLRHTFATDAHRAGVELPIISQALGHAKIRTTYTYVHGRLERMRSIVERGPAAVPLVDLHRALLKAHSRQKMPGT